MSSPSTDISPQESLEELRDYKEGLIAMKNYHLNEVRKLNTEIVQLDIDVLGG